MDVDIKQQTVIEEYHCSISLLNETYIFLNNKVIIPNYFLIPNKSFEFKKIIECLSQFNKNNNNGGEEMINVDSIGVEEETIVITIKRSLNNLLDDLNGMNGVTYCGELINIFSFDNIGIEMIGGNGNGNSISEQSIIGRLINNLKQKITDEAHIMKKESLTSSDRRNYKINTQPPTLKKNKPKKTTTTTTSPNGSKKQKLIHQNNENKKTMVDKLPVDEKKMFSFEYIFSQIKSPGFNANWNADEIKDPYFLDTSKKLYPFQKYSVKLMLERELCPVEFTHENGMKYHDIKGGILCQSMGTGKTIICIALILSTLGSQSKPLPNSFITYPPPTGKFKNNTLEKQCQRYIKLSGIPFKSLNVIPKHLEDQIRDIPFTQMSLQKTKHSVNTKSSTEFLYRNLVCSSTTLLIVPNPILNQWAFELMIHSGDKFDQSGTKTNFKYLVIESVQDIPKSTSTLNKYDVVLITHQLISNLNHKKQTSNMYCSDDTSIDSNLELSSLFKLYWLRIIVDEGHVVGNSNTTLSNLVQFFVSERKWICSGTPISSSIFIQEMANFKSIISFLQVSPYDNDSVFKKLITKPVNQFKTSGIDQIISLMNRIAIRTPLNEIQSQINLPKLSCKNIILQMNEEAKLRYNELVCLIHINLLASQGSGIDSFLSATNQSSALLAITNIKRACYDCDHITEKERNDARKNIITTLLKPDSVIPHQDKLKLLQIFKFYEFISLKLSHTDPTIITSQFYFYKPLPMILPQQIQEPQPQEVNELQLAVQQQPPQGSYELALVTTTTSTSSKRVQFDLPEEREDQNKAMVLVVEPPFIEEKREKCAKLVYLLDKLIEIVGRGEKVIVFSQFNITLNNVIYEVKKVPELSKIFKVYNTELSLKKRSNTILDFQTDDNQFKILFMNTNLSAYGINLTAPNNIIFIDPISSATKEQQAIKRAHRIGQKKDVFVEKLIIQDSFELDLINIYNCIDNSNDGSGNDGGDNSNDIGTVKSEFLLNVEKKEESSRQIKELIKNLKIIPSDTDHFPSITEDEYYDFIIHITPSPALLAIDNK